MGLSKRLCKSLFLIKNFFLSSKASQRYGRCIDTEEIENLRLLGLPITKYNNYTFTLETAFPTGINERKNLYRGIETNGSKPSTDQIIEIGAVMIQGGKEIGKFSSLVKAEILPDSIAQTTGISLQELDGAPL